MMRRILFLGVATLLVGAFLYVFRSSTTVVRAGNARIVNVYIDGSKKVIATDAKTVKSVISDLGVTLGKHDRTEPSLEQEMKGGEYTINVYRARQITVTDGANNYAIMTAERSPAAIAKDAGFEVNEEDDFLYRQTEDTFEGLPGTQMVILRSKPINFSLYGKKSQIYTRAETVQDLLDEREIKLAEKDEINVPLDQKLTANMTIAIDSVVRNTETVEEDAAFEVEEIKDAQQPIGYRDIKTPGILGRKLVTYETVIKNDGKPEKRILKEVITKKPSKQVVIVGARGISGTNAELLRALRTCETGGNYSTNTGNGYYGAYQFSSPTWNSMGTAYSSAHLAPPEVQDDAALRLAQRSGFHSQFPGCSQKLGLPPFPN